MKKAIVLTAVLLLLGLLPAFSQQASRRALAEELMNVINAPSQIEQVISAIKQIIPQQAEKIQQAAGLPPTTVYMSKEQDKIFEFITQFLSWDKMKEDYISVYAEVFTEEEMRGIIDFYKSSPGQAFLKKQPELIKRSMELSQKMMVDLVPKIMEKTKELAKEKNNK